MKTRGEIKAGISDAIIRYEEDAARSERFGDLCLGRVARPCCWSAGGGHQLAHCRIHNWITRVLVEQATSLLGCYRLDKVPFGRGQNGACSGFGCSMPVAAYDVAWR
jgi:hypothetical protein